MQVSCAVLLKQYTVGTSQWTDYFIQSVSRDLPTGIYRLIIDQTKLRAIKNNDGWLISGPE